jgi:hypothetical protein
MGGGAANLDIGAVGFENPGHRVLAAPVVIIVIAVAIVIPVTHPLVVVLTVSHVLPLLPALKLPALKLPALKITSLGLSFIGAATPLRVTRAESQCHSIPHR